MVERGELIDRYVVLDEIGAGGMGVVLKAYDPDLERQVAIKLLKPEGEDTKGSDARLRLLREGRAIAQLSHPNVVAVHDVGTVGDQVFIAMEYVEGETLSSWVYSESRTLAQILQVYLQAGRGLAAAHKAGLLHRDFKPDNVLVGEDGRVRVVDFGLARALEDLPVEGATGPARPKDDSVVLEYSRNLDRSLTGTGSIMGTPAYMAPEQHLGDATSEKTDQFAYCVALYEAVAKQKPFAGQRHPQVAASVLAGNVRPIPPEACVPAWLQKSLLRGLATAPESRFDSMDDLLAELGKDRTRGRRRVLLGGSFGALAAVAIAALVFRGGGAKPACQSAEGELVGVWDDERKKAIEDAFAATERPYAEGTFGLVELTLDRYAEDWAAMRREACEATHVHGKQSGELLDRRMHCLDRRLGEMGALVMLLGKQPDVNVLDKATEAVLSLPAVAACADTEQLLEAVAPPRDTATRRRAEELRARLDEAEALKRAAKYREALPIASPAVEESQKVDYAPLRADALLLLAEIQDGTGEPKLAEASLLAALRSGAESRDDARLVGVLAALVWNLGVRRARYDEALAYGNMASALLPQLSADHPLSIRLFNNVGLVHERVGRYEEAEKYHRLALATAERALGPDSPRLSTSLNNLGNLLIATGNYERAREYYQRAMALSERSLGRDHPITALSISNMAACLRRQGKYGEARRYLERSLAILEAALGGDHLDVAGTVIGLGNLLFDQGKPHEARPFFDRAIAIFERVLDPDDPRLAAAYGNLANVLDETGDRDEARQYYERSLAIRKTTLGPDHPDVAVSLYNLAATLGNQGMHDEARVHYEHALAIWEKALGPDHPGTGRAIFGLGSIQEAGKNYAEARQHYTRALQIWEKALGPKSPLVADALAALARCYLLSARPEDAVPLAERATAILEAPGNAPAALIKARYHLAQALWRARSDRKRAVTVARQAREACADPILAAARTCAAVKTWLAKRGVK